MKKILLYACAAFLLSACSSTYYQLYEADYVTKPDETEISVSYDFWAKEGRMALLITNNTMEVMTIHKDKCFFVLEGMSNCYYQPMTVSESSGIVVSESIRNPWNKGIMSAGYVNTSTVTKQEEMTIRIAPRASVAISGYSIRSTPYHQEGMYGGVKKGEVSRVEFTPDKSPLKFSNVLTYSLADLPEKKTVSHDFYVKSISNHNIRDFIRSMWSNESESGTVQTSPFAAYNRFFLPYSY